MVSSGYVKFPLLVNVKSLRSIYTLGAFQPFFRSHAHIDTKRREPWLFPEDTKLVIRDAIRKRYSYLSYWYTMFYEHERFGLPVMRPLLAHYPQDKESYAIDNEYLLGDKLLVRPVLHQGVSKVDVYFPAKKGKEGDVWYDVDDYRRIERVGYESVPVNSYKVGFSFPFCLTSIFTEPFRCRFQSINVAVQSYRKRREFVAHQR